MRRRRKHATPLLKTSSVPPELQAWRTILQRKCSFGGHCFSAGGLLYPEGKKGALGESTGNENGKGMGGSLTSVGGVGSLAEMESAGRRNDEREATDNGGRAGRANKMAGRAGRANKMAGAVEA